MANGLNKTKRRINSVKSTQKITKAMGMVATVKLKRYRSLYEGSLSYGEELSYIMADLFAHDGEAKSHYAYPNDEAPGSLYILITSDLGLCAGYNAELFKFADARVGEGDTLAPMGNRGVNHYQRNPIKGVKLDLSFARLGLDPDPKELKAALLNVKRGFNEKRYERVYIIYTKYINSLRFEPTLLELLPIELKYEPKPEDPYCPKLYEPEPRRMIHLLMGQYLSAVMMDRLNESKLSEQASRRNAMDNANDNADELLEKLTIEYNKARQAGITQEITEVVAGARAQE